MGVHVELKYSIGRSVYVCVCVHACKYVRMYTYVYICIQVTQTQEAPAPPPPQVNHPEQGRVQEFLKGGGGVSVPKGQVCRKIQTDKQKAPGVEPPNPPPPDSDPPLLRWRLPSLCTFKTLTQRVRSLKTDCVVNAGDKLSARHFWSSGLA